MQHISKHDTDETLSTNTWRTYRKKVLTRAKRMDGPFTVETKEGSLTCPDGYLALDTDDWPYPIGRADFDAMYEAAE